MFRRSALVLLAVGLVAVPAALAAGTPSWPAPKDPMTRTRLAGLVPEVNEHLQYHVHSHLDVFVNGKHVVVPAGIGIDTRSKGVQHGRLPDGSLAYGGIQRCPKVCISPLHTHADLGVLHTETSKPKPNTLGQFFVEWGLRLDRHCVDRYCNDVRVYVNGNPYSGDPRKILLTDREEIAIVIGTPPKTIPKKFPRSATI